MLYRSKLFFLLFFLVFNYTSLFYQILKPISWEFSLDTSSFKLDSTTKLNFKAYIDKGWYLYSTDMESSRPMVTRFNFNDNQDVKLIGGIRRNRKDNFTKIISSKIANFIRSRILRDECEDTGCALKVFDKTIFLSFPFFNGVHRFLPALFKGYGHKTLFVDVNHRKRNHGRSKYGTMNRLFAGIRDILKVNKILKTKL